VPTVADEETMFYLKKEKHYIDYQAGEGEWIEQDALVRDDGVSLRLTGILSERQVEFVYADKDVSLEVSATRFDPTGRQVTDTWEVSLGVALKYAPVKIAPEKVAEITRNLEAALKAWPPFPDERAVQIKHVRFNKQFWRE
jgi:hypothetical protein